MEYDDSNSDGEEVSYSQALIDQLDFLSANAAFAQVKSGSLGSNEDETSNSNVADFVSSILSSENKDKNQVTAANESTAAEDVIPTLSSSDFMRHTFEESSTPLNVSHLFSLSNNQQPTSPHSPPPVAEPAASIQNQMDQNMYFQQQYARQSQQFQQLQQIQQQQQLQEQQRIQLQLHHRLQQFSLQRQHQMQQQQHQNHQHQVQMQHQQAQQAFHLNRNRSFDFTTPPPTATNTNRTDRASESGNDDKDDFIEITPFLTLSQEEASKKLGIPSSTLSKRWREATNNRKWPFRTLFKLDREIKTLMQNISSGEGNPTTHANLSLLLRQRQEEGKPVYIKKSKG